MPISPPDSSSPLSAAAATTPYACVDVLNYGGGNLGSMLRALERLAIPYRVWDGLDAPASHEEHHQSGLPDGSQPLLLPGVGAFGSVMQGLKERGFDALLKRLVGEGSTPFLGVCVGQQVLFESSEESPDVAGLGLLKGAVRRFTAGKVPQIGWNHVANQQPASPFAADGFVYYVNSYYAAPADAACTLYASHYEGCTFCGAVHQGNITAFQFHPEKSGAFGHELIAQWWQHCQTEARHDSL